MFLTPTYDSTTEVVLQLISQLKLPVTKKTIITELELHPDYPSLLAINDVLNQFGIANYPFNNITIEKLLHVPCPFIAHTKNKQFLLIKDINKTSVQLNDTTISLDDFAAKFDGVIMAVEPLEEAGDKNYNENKWLQTLDALRTPVSLAGLVAITMLALIYQSSYLLNINWQIAAVTLFKLAGVITSILLLIQSIDSNNPLIQKLCQNDTNKNCNAILSSPAAKAFSGLTWSEVGYFYFSGTFLTLLFNSNSISILQILSILNIISLPYTFYSIYYQWRVAKVWCVLCSTIQGLLWLEFIPLITMLKMPLLAPTAKELSSLLICFITPFIAWIWIKPFLVNAQKITPLNKQLNKFKYNIDLFNKLLTEQIKYTTPDTSWSVVLGNMENPDKIITMVSNPYCGPCDGAHKIIDELLESKNNIQVRFVFVFNNIFSEDDKRMVVARHLLALDTNGNKTMVKNALHDWYTLRQKDFTEWTKKYPTNYDDGVISKLEQQTNWRNIAEIISTPTTLINGYKLPYPYQLDDLKYF